MADAAVNERPFPAEVIRIRDKQPVFRVERDSKKLLDAKSSEDIVKTWFLGTKYTAAERDSIVAAMMEKGIFPDTWAHDRELKSGLYPDIQDPRFGAQLYNKQEFFEARAAAISALEGTDPCNSSVESVFEISPIQKLVSRFLNPKTPYNGLLLYHGVGVGKTCSAVRVGEEYLKFYPLSKVFIIVPQAISGGFKRTIFDPSKLRKEGNKWVSQQCTGMIYPELALHELGKKAKKEEDFTVEEINDAVDKKIRERYFRFGYLQFAYWIQKQLKMVPSHLIGDDRIAAENLLLAKLFSDKLVIIDEAHNLRDAVAGTVVAEDDNSSANDAEEVGEEEGATGAAIDTVGGKRLTPLLKRIVKYAEGLKLLLMSATPMYNKAAEISHLLNLLIVNDTKDDSPKKLIGNIFTADGNLKKGGDIIIRTYSQRYISYMRGENPYTFPLRVRPSCAQVMVWPRTQKVGGKEKTIVMSKDAKNIIEALPLVHILPIEGSAISDRLMSVLREGKAEDFKAETWVHLDICNIVYPNGYYGHTGWDSYFTPVLTKGDGLSYHSFGWKGTEEDEGIESVDDIFGQEALRHYAPKMWAVVEKLQASTGMSFVYSRYVKAGILPLAIALERAGWTRVFDSAEPRPVFRGTPVPRQCAFCSKKENTHAGARHAFAPANFVVLTGNNPDTIITPNFMNTLNYASRWASDDLMAPHGGKVKAILGSQITTEGLDLKCIRGIHILDPWYHLNRLEQIIGRGIRFCSHAELDIQLRNCLIYMYALTIPKIETPDLHAYRLSAEKAVAIGRVQREMKISAMDCNLNIAGLIVRGAPPRRIVDIEGRVIEEYNIDDKKYTSTCDYLEECNYECLSPAAADGEKDIKTYTYNDAQKRLAEKEERLKALFSTSEIAIPIESIRKHIYGDLPWEIVSRALVRILENPNFIIKREDGLYGYLILQNDYLLFQPTGIRAKQIPLAYRYSRVYNVLPRRSLLPHRGSIMGAVKATRPVAAAVAAAGPAAAAAAAAVEPDVSNPVAAFNAWMKMVDAAIRLSKPGDRDIIKRWAPPKGTASFHIQAWGWLLFKFCNIPEIRTAAAQYYVDSAWKPSERKAVLEQILAKGRGHADFSQDLINAVERDLFQLTEIAGFKWLNSTTFDVETLCLQNSHIEMCPKTFDTLITAKIGKPLDIKTGTGGLFGFLVPKKDGTMVFKTLDKSNSKRITGAVGSDCSLASDLDGYRSRVAQTIQEINRLAPAMSPLLVSLKPEDAAPNLKARKVRQETDNIVHIDDLSHIYICIYVETLLRLMDIKKLAGTRWFLNAVEAARAGLKGR